MEDELARAKQFKQQSQKFKTFHGNDPVTHHEHVAGTILIYKAQLKQALAKKDEQKIEEIRDKIFAALGEQVAAKLRAYQEHYHMIPEGIQQAVIEKYTKDCIMIQLFIEQALPSYESE